MASLSLCPSMPAPTALSLSLQLLISIRSPFLSEPSGALQERVQDRGSLHEGGGGLTTARAGDKSLAPCQDGVGLEGIFQRRGGMFVSYRQRRHGQREAGEGQLARCQ